MIPTKLQLEQAGATGFGGELPAFTILQIYMKIYQKRAKVRNLFTNSLKNRHRWAIFFLKMADKFVLLRCKKL